ncbi:ATP-binding protein [Dactylosporangium sp. NPDC005555]|uniref:ATP-binding protein n=1 Tax=Dactylosporangium sp. NPDC005555 TaxID=3154889 RepID=UPI0033A3A316
MPKPIAVTLRRQFVWLVVVLLSVGAARFFAGHYLTGVHDAQLRDLAGAQQANQRILQDLTDIETGVRGYQLTGDPLFLEPFRTGAADYPRAHAEALRTAPDDRTRILVRDQDQAAQRWLAQVALPISALPAGRPGLDADRSARGKELFDAIRAANAAVGAAVEEARAAATAAYHRASSILEVALALLALLPVLVALRIYAAVNRMLLAPLARLQDTLERRAGGDRDARAVVEGPAEVRRLGAALNAGLDEAGEARERIVSAADEVAAQKAYLDQVLDVVEVAVLTSDAEGRVVHSNRAARRLGLAAVRPPAPRPVGAADVVPRPVSAAEVVPAPAAAADVVPGREIAADVVPGPVGAVEVVPGREITAGDRCVVVDARPLSGGAGWVTTGRDVTDLREREADLAAFAAVAAHDLRSPLATISRCTEILAGQVTDQDDAALVTRIGSGVERMRGLIEDLLAYATARDAVLEPAPMDVTALITGLSPAVVVDGPLPVLDADPAMLRRLFDTLIGNALRSTPPGRAADVHVSASASADGGVCLVVADRGIGIPADLRGRLFTPFHRGSGGRSYSGTGLGLAICQRVVARHGGTIAASGNPGGGTRVEITLPASRVAQPVPS